MTDITQWTTATPLISNRPQWISGQDQERIAAYALYESLYWNIPDAFKLVQRGKDAKPIYVPAPKQVVETMHRFLAPGITFIADPELGSTTEQKLANDTMRVFMRREKVASKFSAAKRYGLIRGDWVFHIVADEERPEGARISFLEIDPASYFPIEHPDDPDTIIGCHIVEPWNENGDDYIYRLTYRKVTEMGGPSPITVEEAIYEMDAWGGPDMDETTVRVIRPEEQLPAPIDQLPVYHIPNFSETGSRWGSSEFRGIERLFAAINQSISDEELELVLNGLGVWVTDAGQPQDPETGADVPWNLGPGRVVTLPNGKKFERATATSSVEPHQAHLKYLHDQLDQGAGIPAVAKGLVDVQLAESGIALALHMAPIVATSDEKDLVVTDVTTNMLWDLKAWFIAYEGINIGEETAWIPRYREKLPKNREKEVDTVLRFVTDGIASREWAIGELKNLGYDLGDAAAMLNQIMEEKAALAQIESDVEGSRLDNELSDEDQPEDEEP